MTTIAVQTVKRYGYSPYSNGCVGGSWNLAKFQGLIAAALKELADQGVNIKNTLNIEFLTEKEDVPSRLARLVAVGYSEESKEEYDARTDWINELIDTHNFDKDDTRFFIELINRTGMSPSKAAEFMMEHSG